MGSSILRLNSCHGRISIPENHVRRILCSAGMSTVTGGGDPAVRRVAPPWLMLPPSSVEGGETACYSMYSLSQGKVVRLEQETKSPYTHHNAKVVGSSHGWLALFNERDCNLFLWNPITLGKINFPPLHTLSALSLPITVLKVTLSCPPEGGDECVAVMALVSALGKVIRARCCPGRSTLWTPSSCLLGSSGSSEFHLDFVYSSRCKLLFSLGYFDDGRVKFPMELLNLQGQYGSASFLRSERDFYGDRTYEIQRNDKWRLYVVYAEHSDQLFVVTRLLGNRNDDDDDTCKTVGFHVHRLKYGDWWRGIKTECHMKESLDGLVMFVGPNHSAAMAAAEFPELKPNSIYFTGDDIGVYDYENKTISPCYYPNGDAFG